MVGVPRSKGCRLCVQRRVKCDQNRPTCKNCVRGNRSCPGYDQPVKFLDEGPRLRNKYDFQSPGERVSDLQGIGGTDELGLDSSPEVTTSAEASSVAYVRVPDNVGDQASTILGYVEGRTDAFVNFDLSDPKLLQIPSVVGTGSSVLQTRYNPKPSIHPISSPILSPDLIQLQLLQIFSGSIAPLRRDLVPDAMKSHSRWLAFLPGRSGSNLLLDTAIRAVTTVHIGRLHRSNIFVNESRQYYGRALKLLNKAVADPISGMSNNTLCATILLSFYEMFASDHNASWIRHAGGAGALMRMRGAKRHRSGFDREMYLAYRHTLIIEALQQSKPCFLTNPEWQDVSEQIYEDIIADGSIPPDKIDIFQAAEMFYRKMAEFTKLGACAHHVEEYAKKAGTDLVIYKQVLFTDLKEHRMKIKQSHSTFMMALNRLGHLPTSTVTNDPIISVNYVYANHFIASFLVGYWTVLTILNVYIIEVGVDLADIALVNERELEIYQQENREISLEECRSINYMLRSLFLGPFFATFALRLASQVFQPTEAEWIWVVGKLFEIGDRHILMAKHIPWFSEQGGNVEDLIALI